MKFMDISTDLKTLIISHVHRPADMIALCLTNKQLHEITVRQLYHTVTLDIGSPSDTRLAAFLNPRNIGLRWVRDVELYRSDVMEKGQSQVQVATFAIRMLLEFLPQNILEKFRCVHWHPWEPLSADNLILLYQKQKKMKWLEAVSVDKVITPAFLNKLNLDSAVEHTTQLGLYPDDRDTLEFSNALLRRTKKLQKLALHAYFNEADPPIPSRELNDSSTEPGLISRTIFSHMLPFDKCKPIQLRELFLQNINLRYASNTYCKVIHFSQLKILRVISCSGADALFAELCRSTRLPDKLEILEFKHEDLSKESEAMDALDGFLCLLDSLRQLTIDVSYTKALPAVTSITRHAKTLKLLNVHAINGDPTECDEDEHVYDTEMFEKICKNCTLLEQLSTAFPATQITRDYSDEFSAFMAADALRNLRTLNITTWPTNQPTTSRLPRPKYEQLLQGMAQTIFDACAEDAARNGYTSKLSVIAWGSSDKVYPRETNVKNTIVFVKGKQVDPFGKESPLAMPIPWCLTKYVEPKSDVLDFNLMRSVRPPTREPPPADDGELNGW